MASVFVAHRLSCSLACGIFLDQESTHVPCIGRGILNHWTNRGVFEGESFTYLSPGFWWLLTALSVTKNKYTKFKTTTKKGFSLRA